MRANIYAVGAARKSKARKPKPRPEPLPIDDIDLPAGPRVVLAWPPVQASPNWRGSWHSSSDAKAKYRTDCGHRALEAGLHKVRFAVREIAAAGRVAVRVDFFPPANASNYDDDNAVAAFKAGRDGIADVLQVDDKAFRPEYVHHPEKRSCVVFTLVAVTGPGEGA